MLFPPRRIVAHVRAYANIQTMLHTWYAGQGAIDGVISAWSSNPQSRRHALLLVCYIVSCHQIEGSPLRGGGKGDGKNKATLNVRH